MELWTALAIGLAGSLHCVGMCGPIVLALPTGGRSALMNTLGRLSYNFGRVVTYALLGFVCGLIGKTIHVAGYQQSLSIALGVLILLAVVLPSRYGKYITGAGLHARIHRLTRGLWAHLQQRRTVPSLFGIGILNGFLPCGLVYVALAGSIATASPVTGAAYMAVFGFGTIPILLLTALFGNLIGVQIKRRLYKLLPAGVVVLAALFILRGMSLGIPLISPEMTVTEQGETTVNCCHPAEPDTSPNGK